MLNQTIAPTTYLVTLDELKLHLSIDDSDSDSRLTMLLEASRDLIEHDAGICFTEQTWTQTFKRYPPVFFAGKIPVQEISFTYYDENNEQQTLDESNYYLLPSGYRFGVVPVLNFPTVYDRPEAITATITCGMTTVPAMAKQACLLLCGAWNELREAENLIATNEIKIGYERLIQSLRGKFLC